jgi:hypothetical protein
VVGGESARGLPPELGDHEGALPSFNHIGPGDATWGFSVKRARFGLRGRVPETEGRATYALAAEFGDNKLTRTEPVVLTDAAINLRAAPQLQLRLGQFKLPTAEEAIENNPQAAHFVDFSAGLTALLLESPVEDGVYTGGASGLRDVGAMAWGRQALGPAELSYGFMVSNGRMGGLDVDDAKDLTGRLSVGLLGEGDPRDPQRDELRAFAWWQQGQRSLEGVAAPPAGGAAEGEAAGDAAGEADSHGGGHGAGADRQRRGFGLNYQHGGLHLRSELIDATGVIDAGYRLPFTGQAVVMLPEAQGRATNTFAHYTAHVGAHGHLGGGLRYDRYRRWTTRPADERVFHALTLNATVGLGAHLHLLLDYERLSAVAPQGSAGTAALLDTMGDRVAGELVARF